MSRTLYPRFHDLMHVLVGASARAQRRRGGGALKCRLTWSQILEDLTKQRSAFNLEYPGSKRSLARWLAALERFRFIHRDTVTHRARDGRIRYRLTEFTFAVAGIQWIKQLTTAASAHRGSTMVPLVAARFKVSALKPSPASANSSVDNYRDPRSRGGERRPPRTAALRARVRSSTHRAVRPTALGKRKSRGRRSVPVFTAAPRRAR